MKVNLVGVLATLNELLRQVSTSLPKIHQATGGLLQRETTEGKSVSVNGLSKAAM